MENNLPYFFIVFPKWFEDQFPQLVANVRINARRLITGFDIHRTLQHFLHLQTKATPWSNEAAAAADKAADADKLSPQESFSLLTEIPMERTCEKAGIPDAYCGCFQLQEVDVSRVTFKNDVSGGELNDGVSKMIKDGAIAIVTKINEALKDVFDICVKWKVTRLLKASKKPKEEKFMIRIEVKSEKSVDETGKPFAAIFQGWVVTNKAGSFDIKLGEISRIDRYGDTSKCVLQRAYKLKEYCRCIK